jgi:hypothetical protein
MQLDVEVGLARQQGRYPVDGLNNRQRHHARIEAAELTGPLTGAQQLFEVRGALGERVGTDDQAAIGTARAHRNLNESYQRLAMGVDEFQIGFDIGAQSSGR